MIRLSDSYVAQEMFDAIKAERDALIAEVRRLRRHIEQCSYCSECLWHCGQGHNDGCSRAEDDT